MNGPLGGRAFALEGSDDVQFGNAPSPANQINQVVVPPAPAAGERGLRRRIGRALLGLASARRAVQRLFVGPIRRPPNAALELTRLPAYTGPRDSLGPSHAGSSLSRDISGRHGRAVPLAVLYPAHLHGGAADGAAAGHLLAGHRFHDRPDDLPAGAERDRYRRCRSTSTRSRAISTTAAASARSPTSTSSFRPSSPPTSSSAAWERR